MKFLPFGYLFDWPEFLLGILMGIIAARLSLNYWPKVLKLPSQLQVRLNTIPRSDFAAEVSHYRDQILAHLDRMHSAAPLFDLRDILITPNILLPPPSTDPDREDDYSRIIQDIVPTLPDWNPLAAIYHTPSIPVDRLVGRGHNFLLTGEPGSGRSTALAYLAYHLLTPGRERAEKKAPLPILIHAADIRSGVNEKDPLKVILNAVRHSGSFNGFGKITALITRHIQRKQAILLLDGLDETPLQSRGAVEEFLKKIRFSFPDLQIIAAGEPGQLHLYKTAGFVPAPIAPWTSLDCSHFTQRWSHAWKMNIATRLPRRLTDIDPTLINAWLLPTLSGLTPLEVALRSWSAYAGDLRSQAVNDCFDAYLGRMLSPPEHKGAEQLAAAWLTAYLGKSRIHTADRDLLNELIHAGICRPGSTPDQIVFSCSATGAYLAARAFAGSGVPSPIIHAPTSIGETLLRYFSGHTDAADAARTRLQNEDPDLQKQLLSCARWLREAVPGSAWRSAVLAGLAQIISKENSYGLRFRAVGALVHAGESKASQLFTHMLAQPDAHTRILGALGLGGLHHEEAVPDLIMTIRNDQDSLVRQACTIALSVIGNDLALETLGRLLLQGSEQAQATAASALPANIDEGHQMLRDGLEMKKAGVRRATVMGLEHIHAGWVDQRLEHLKLEDDEWVVRNAAVEVSERRVEPPLHFPPPADRVPGLSWLISFASGQGLGVPDGPGAMEVLRRAISQGTLEEKAAGLESTIWFGDNDFLPEIRQNLRSENPHLRDTAFEVLWKFSLMGAIPGSLDESRSAIEMSTFQH